MGKQSTPLSNTEIKSIIYEHYPDETSRGILVDRIINGMSWAYLFDKYADDNDFQAHAYHRFRANASCLLRQFYTIMERKENKTEKPPIVPFKNMLVVRLYQNKDHGNIIFDDGSVLTEDFLIKVLDAIGG